MAEADEEVSTLPQSSTNLFHIVLTTYHLSHDVRSEGQRVRICGTYTSLSAAKAVAHRILFDAGYEREWFSDYKAVATDFADNNIKFKDGLIVMATSIDGTTFRVSIDVSMNKAKYLGDEEGKVETKLFHVVQTIIKLNDEEDGEIRETKVQASFPSYAEARSHALGSLLADRDGLNKANFAIYDEAQPTEVDCGFGEDVIVHAVGQNGENYLVSILAEQELEAMRLVDASKKIR